MYLQNEVKRYKLSFKRCTCRQASVLPGHEEVCGSRHEDVKYASCTYLK